MTVGAASPSTPAPDLDGPEEEGPVGRPVPARAVGVLWAVAATIAAAAGLLLVGRRRRRHAR